MNSNTPDTTTSWSNRFRWINLLGPLLFLIVVGALVVRAETFHSQPGAINNLRLDYEQGYRGFHNDIYYPTRALVSGVNPYSEMYEEYHPDGVDGPMVAPSALLLHLYVGFLNVQTAEIVYLCVNIALLIFIGWFCVRDSTYPFAFGAIFLVASAILICRPGMLNHHILHMTLLITVGVLLALEFADKSPALSGFGLLLAFCKPTFAIPLAIMMLFRRNLSAFAIGVLFCVGANLGVLWHIGNQVGGVQQAYRQSEAYLGPRLFEEGPVDIEMVWGKLDLYSVVTRWADVSSVDNLMFYIPLGVLVFGLLIVLFERNPNHRTGINSRTGLFALLIMLSCVYHQPLDAMVLTIPLAALLLGHQKMETGINVVSRTLVMFLLMIPMFNFLATGFAMSYFKIEDGMSPPETETNDLMTELAFAWPWKLTVTINGIAIALAAIIVAFSILGSRSSRAELD